MLSSIVPSVIRRVTFTHLRVNVVPNNLYLKYVIDCEHSWILRKMIAMSVVALICNMNYELGFIVYSKFKYPALHINHRWIFNMSLTEDLPK